MPDQAAFDAFLGANGTRLALVSTANLNMPAIAMHFVDWVERGLETRPDNDPNSVVVLLKAAAQHAPQHQSAPLLRVAATRLAQVLVARAVHVPAWEMPHVDGVPVVNRSGLRAALQTLVNQGTRPPVVMVHGERGTGRSHSWYLIDRVAARHHVRTQVFRLETLTSSEQQTAERMFTWMVERLGLTSGQSRTNIGTTPRTAGSKFADALVEAVALTANVTPAWLVFDSVDRKLAPQVKSFLCELAHRKLRGDLQPYILFLLGAGPEFGIADEMLRPHMEGLTEFLHSEIRQTAQRLNDLGSKKLEAADLDARVAELIAQLNGSVAENCKRTAQAMVRLIRDVGA